MAKRVIHELIDDINGQPAAETIQFGIDGSRYEIDLTSKNAAKFRDALAPFVTAGTKLEHERTTSGRGRRPPGHGSRVVDRSANKDIRDWARSHNMLVSDRGRIKQEIVDRYNARTRRQ